MKKPILLFSVVMIAGFASLSWMDLDEEQTVLPEAAAKDKKTQDLFVNYYTFKRSFDATIGALAKGEMSLVEARDQVRRIAEAHNPDFFAHLEAVEVGATTDERLAYNLVGHIRGWEEVRPNRDSRLAELEEQLRELVN